jgi:molybdate/tungstate transport system substrate-binding protein
MRPLLSIALSGGCAAVLTVTGCSSSGGAKSASTGNSAGVSAGASASPAKKHSGTVKLLSAGSLLTVVEKGIGPGFHDSTGYTVSNFSAGSKDLAADIKGKVKQGDVFISASPATNATLEGAANGDWVSWYATFATSQLVLGYNPHSKFADDLKTKPWYDVITEPGLRIGLTPPASDPKGVLAVKALDTTATAKNLPALTAIGSKSSNQFPETSLSAEVAAGQLDVGFFYQAEANAANIPTVPLTGVDLKATYTVTVLKNAPNEAAAEAFVAYLLSAAGQADLNKYGFAVITPPTLSGSGVPTSLQGIVH